MELERGHRTLVITRKGGKVVTILLVPRTARASTSAPRACCFSLPTATSRPARRRPDRPPCHPLRWDQHACLLRALAAITRQMGAMARLQL